MSKKVGVIGVGEMGKPFSKRLLANGYDVTIRGHVNMKPVEELQKLGAKVAKSPRELAAYCETIVIFVSTTAQTEDVLWGKDGVIESVKPGSVIIIMSTVNPFMVQEAAAKFKEKGVAVLDAPVSAFRGVGVEEGKMVILAGGDKAAFEKCLPMFNLWNNVFYLGGSGSGEFCKIVNNMLVFLNTVALVGAKSMLDSAGVDWSRFMEFLKVSSGNSASAQRWEFWRTSWLDWEKKGEEPWHTMYKDMREAQQMADDLKVKIPVLGAAYNTKLIVK